MNCGPGACAPAARPPRPIGGAEVSARDDGVGPAASALQVRPGPRSPASQSKRTLAAEGRWVSRWGGGGHGALAGVEDQRSKEGFAVSPGRTRARYLLPGSLFLSRG